MFFSIGRRIFELKLKDILLTLFSILLIGAAYFLYITDFVSLSPILWTYGAYLAVLIFLIFLAYIFAKYRFFQNLAIYLNLNQGFLELEQVIKKSSGKALKVFVIILILVWGIYFFSNYDLPHFSMDLNIKNPLIGKEPQIESPKLVEITTTTQKVTTTTKKKSGFVFFDKKQKYDEPKDCTFDGRGHEAILMPSGYYYCRSTEKRVTVKINGVETLCCVAP